MAQMTHAKPTHILSLMCQNIINAVKGPILIQVFTTQSASK